MARWNEDQFLHHSAVVEEMVSTYVQANGGDDVDFREVLIGIYDANNEESDG